MRSIWSVDSTWSAEFDLAKHNALEFKGKSVRILVYV